MVFDAEIPLKEIDHRQVARRLAIGDRTGLEDEPTLHAMRVGDFPDQARLAYASFPHYGDDLPTASCGTCARRSTRRYQWAAPAPSPARGRGTSPRNIPPRDAVCPR